MCDVVNNSVQESACCEIGIQLCPPAFEMPLLTADNIEATLPSHVSDQSDVVTDSILESASYKIGIQLCQRGFEMPLQMADNIEATVPSNISDLSNVATDTLIEQACHKCSIQHSQPTFNMALLTVDDIEATLPSFLSDMSDKSNMVTDSLHQSTCHKTGVLLCPPVLEMPLLTADDIEASLPSHVSDMSYVVTDSVQESPSHEIGIQPWHPSFEMPPLKADNVESTLPSDLSNLSELMMTDCLREIGVIRPPIRRNPAEGAGPTFSLSDLIGQSASNYGCYAKSSRLNRASQFRNSDKVSGRHNAAQSTKTFRSKKVQSNTSKDRSNTVQSKTDQSYMGTPSKAWPPMGQLTTVQSSIGRSRGGPNTGRIADWRHDTPESPFRRVSKASVRCSGKLGPPEAGLSRDLVAAVEASRAERAIFRQTSEDLVAIL
jgi:hypothetical protein